MDDDDDHDYYDDDHDDDDYYDDDHDDDLEVSSYRKIAFH